MKTHQIKIWPEEFADVRDGLKTFQMRKDDRDYSVGDILVLEEFRPGVGTYTGRSCRADIVYIERNVDNFGLMSGFAVLGLGPIREG